MNAHQLVAVLALTALPASAPAAEPHPAAAALASIGGGTYRPLYGAPVAVAPFRLDRRPVTNARYLEFVRTHPEWRRDRVAPVFAEPTYLSAWAGADELGPRAEADQPVVVVSGVAARAYCEAAGERLPSEAEWEVAAAASPTSADASDDPRWRAEVLALDVHALPTTLPRVGQGTPNVWGVYDLHGLVWEWVDDFQAATLALDGNPDRLRTCGGAGAAGAGRDGMDFAAFERMAMRTALVARATTSSLGFRCAADVDKGAS